MEKLGDADGVDGTPVTFARNRLVIAVEPGNPKKIETLADTVDADVQLVLCAPAVPCGRYARAAYEKAGVRVPELPTGLTAKDTLSKVALGEADAAVVYATDVKAAKGDVTGVRIPAAANVIAEYPIAVVAATENGVTARAFLRFVRSRSGQATLQKLGFRAP
jgi:molybdate transport system substrate-binding protein